MPSKEVHSRSYLKYRVTVIGPLELKHGKDISKVFDHVDVIITTGVTSQVLSKKMSEMNDPIKEKHKAVIVVKYIDFYAMEDIVRGEEGKDSDFQQIFEDIVGNIEPEEEIKMEQDDDEHDRDNAVSIQYEYDEIGFEN